MASRQDVQKRQAWETRFERFRAGGLTVAQFCKQQRVSIHSFYYWARRVGSKAIATPASGSGRTPQRSRRPAKHAATTSRTPGAAAVRFSWNGIEVSVPADCLDAIRCLAECFQHMRAERPDAFQEVVVRQ